MAGSRQSNAITRAVGVQPTLALDMLRDTVCAGDRFLLCSDGLTRTVTESQIEAWMESEDIGDAVQGLISATLAAGAPDNVTVLIAEAYADTVNAPELDRVRSARGSVDYTDHLVAAAGPVARCLTLGLLRLWTFGGNR